MKLIEQYETGDFFDEWMTEAGAPRNGMEIITQRLKNLSHDDLLRRQKQAESYLYNLGITFNVYGNTEGIERIIPFDLLPRVISAAEWTLIEKGLKQRIYALNLFIDDLYHEQKILKDGVIPEFVIKSCKDYREQCVGLKPPKGVWCHVTGTDLVRNRDGDFYVLEDNMRCPSGVSYVLENREVMKRCLPQFFSAGRVRPVEDYPDQLLKTLEHLAPSNFGHPEIAVLTPGYLNAAYFEHSFLAQQMGVELVEGRDLVVENNRLMMRTTKGFERVDVLYRRIDDDFLDPLTFRADSLLGIPGLMDVYKKGWVALANAPGTGVADDKVVYAYTPDIIRYYTGDEPILPIVPTYLCWKDEDKKYVLEHIEELVVKPANASGGYGLMIGPHATKEEHARCKASIEADPRNYIAQPAVSLSRVPTIIDDRFEGRHVDLRPYILYGNDIYVLPGGLTRVAMEKGSLVVNSSQGGGSKDTWVWAEETHEKNNGYDSRKNNGKG